MENKMIKRDVYVNHAILDVARIAKITRQLYERQQFAYLMVDHSWSVIETSENLGNYGFSDLDLGKDARESIDFLVGLDSTSTLDLPIVISPTGHPVHVVLLPEDENLTIVLMDASREYEQQQLVQQKANENGLLLSEQRRLTQDLKVTQNELLARNQELKEASRLQTGFMSGVSHEFRTPLAALLGYVDVLRDRLATQETDKSVDQLNVIGRSARHLLSLVENLLDHGKLDANEMVLKPHVVDAQELVKEIEAILQPTVTNSQINLSVTATPSPLPHCLLDDSRVRQILLNLVGNAIKFTDAGDVKVNVSWLLDELSFEISDTGIGIAENDLTKVRQPFFQAGHTGRVGTGLGLTITEQVVEMMGGSLDMQSKLGQGTVVTVVIPAPQVDPENELASPQRNITATGTQQFLLAEDDPDIAALLMILLEEQGVDVTHVENGELAVEAAQNQRFDVVLMDLQMPVLDGYDATTQLRAAGNTTPVLVMTASAIEADRSRAEQAGCDGYLVKPVAVDELMALAEELQQSETAHHNMADLANRSSEASHG